jgi:hypothetical protein
MIFNAKGEAYVQGKKHQEGREEKAGDDPKRKEGGEKK